MALRLCPVCDAEMRKLELPMDSAPEQMKLEHWTCDKCTVLTLIPEVK